MLYKEIKMAVTYTYNGKEQTVAEIANQNGLSYKALSKRIKKCNYNLEEALDMKNTNKPIEMIGKKYNRMTVLSDAGRNKHNQKLYNCICDCGAEKVVVGHDLRYGKTKSCGCYNIDRITSHGMSNTKVYKVWAAMLDRCNNKDNPNYKYYGEQGVAVCDEWLEFENFYKDMGEPNGLTIDRIDGSGNYCKENCRWADRKTQSNNIKNNVTIEYKSEVKTVGELADITGIPINVLRWRVSHGWSAERTIETPVGTPKTQNKFTKAVVQLDKDGNKINEYKSITDAANSVGISTTAIGYVCNGKRATAGGFKWKFKEK